MLNIDGIVASFFSGLPHAKFSDILFELVSASIYLAVIASIAIVHYWWVKGKKSKLYAILFSAVMVALLITTELLKRSVNRTRPDGELFSFPSRHAALAFFIALALPIEKKWKICLLTWAALVSFSRLWLGVHWLSDVVVGVVLGVISWVIFEKLKQVS